MKVPSVRMKSYFLLILLVASVLPLLLQPTSAQSNPSVPQFTITIANHSYDIAAKSSTDPYTGNATITPGVSINWQTLDLTVPNEKYTGRTVNGYQYYYGYLYYVRYKGHFAMDWIEENSYNYYFPQNTSQANTTLSFVLNDNYVDLVQDGVPDTLVPAHSITLPYDGQVDFQVKAKVGALYQVITFGRTLAFNGTESAWSNTLTVYLSNGTVTSEVVGSNDPTVTPIPLNPTETPTPTLTPSQTPVASVNPNQSVTKDLYALEFGWQTIAIVILVLVVAILVVIVAFQHKRKGNINLQITRYCAS